MQRALNVFMLSATDGLVTAPILGVADEYVSPFAG
jgi:hypothetical protein